MKPFIYTTYILYKTYFLNGCKVIIHFKKKYLLWDYVISGTVSVWFLNQSGFRTNHLSKWFNDSPIKMVTCLVNEWIRVTNKSSVNDSMIHNVVTYLCNDVTYRKIPWNIPNIINIKYITWNTDLDKSHQVYPFLNI